MDGHRLSVARSGRAGKAKNLYSVSLRDFEYDGQAVAKISYKDEIYARIDGGVGV